MPKELHAPVAGIGAPARYANVSGMAAPALAHHDAAANTKRLATLSAHMALAGFELHVTASGTFIVSRWNLARELHDLAAVQAFARRAGVRT